MRASWIKEEDDILVPSSSSEEAFNKLKKLGYNRTKSAICQRRSKKFK